MYQTLIWRRSGALLLVLLLSAASLFAQGKGKITGHVTDAETKTPLIGTTVLVAGTTLGAVTDADGEYTILNVPPGRWRVIASMIGYRRMEVKDVKVNIDLTTTLDFALTPAAVEMSAVVVEAREPVIVKDRTETATSISTREIESAPIEGLRQIMDLDASIQRNPNGTITIRGSGAYEINYMINGVTQTTASTGNPGWAAVGDKANNTWKYDFNPLGVQQMQVISGGFSAEYGNAQAGVVKVVTKEGSDRITGEVRFEYRPPGQYHWGEYVYSHNAFEWKDWGTLDQWRRNLDSTTIVGTYQVPPDSVDIWRQLMYNQWVLNHEPGDANLLGAYDYRQLSYKRIMFGFGGPLGTDAEALRFFASGEYRYNPTRIPTSEKVQKYQNYSLTMTYQPQPVHKLRLGLMYQQYHGGVSSGAEDIRWAGPDAKSKYYLVTESPRDEYTTAQSLTWTWTISPKSFLEVMATHQLEKYILILQPVPQRASTWRDNVFRGFWYISAGPWDEGYRTIYSWTTFNQQDLRSHFYGLKGDYTNQITPSNMLKAGFDLQYWDMWNSAVYSSYAANAFITRTGFAEFYSAYPYYGAFYLQDKMEYQGMVANVGVRVDGYNFNTAMPADRFNPFYFAEGSATVGDPETKLPKTYVNVSPRLGLSFPIGEATAFRIQYGHFISMPIFSQAYARTNWAGWASYGNADLGPKKTINYEFGIQHSIGGTHRLDVVAYYNDRVSQIGTLRIHAGDGSIYSTPSGFYSTSANNQFGATRGVDVTFEKVASGQWKYRLAYSLSRTTYGYYGSTRLWSPDPNDPRNFQDPYAPTDFLSYDDKTHSFRALVSYTVPEESGLGLFGVRPFENMTLSVTYTATSGVPFSYVPSYDTLGANLYKAYVNDQVTNNRRFPLEARMDLNITKSLKFGGTMILLGIRVMNVFDNHWLTPMDYKTTPLSDWVERGINMMDPGTDPTRQVYRFNYYQAYRNIPRQVFFTVGVGI